MSKKDKNNISTNFLKLFLGWPDGYIWRITEKYKIKLRRKKFDLFVNFIKPSENDKILDVGVSNCIERCTNYFEIFYPYKKNITALGIGNEKEYSDFKKEFPEVKLIIGDGKNMYYYSDNYFDMAFSNAVVEHVGDRGKQRKFIYELVRVSKKGFITTPSYWFPIELHTMLPFIHWLPKGLCSWLYKKLGLKYWGDINNLNLLKSKEFLALFPKIVNVRIIGLKIFGLTYNLIAIYDKT